MNPGYFLNGLTRLKNFIPHLLLVIFGLCLILVAPGDFKDDAGQYRALGESILRGAYEVVPGVSSMFREPGYPLFRAIIFGVTHSQTAILLVQLALAIATCELWRRIWRNIESGYDWLGSYGCLLAFGYWGFVRFHLYEILVGVLLALAVYLTQRSMAGGRWHWLVCLGAALGFLSLTRGVFILLFLPVAIWGFVALKRKMKTGKASARLAVVVCVALVLPGLWMARNLATFHVFGLAGRSGTVFYIRAVKADMPWTGLRDAYVSTFIGKAFAKRILPESQYIGGFVEKTWKADVLTLGGMEKADSILMARAKSTIFGSGKTLIKYCVWSGVDVLHLLALPSFRYVWDSVENTFAAQLVPLSLAQKAYLVCIMLWQFVWWIGGTLGCWLGWRKYGSEFVVAIPYLYLIAIHTPLDNVVRFSAPIQPIIGAFVLFSLSTAFGRVATALHKRKAMLTSLTEV